MKTHRCDEMFEHNKDSFRNVFIRYEKEHDFDIPNNKLGWWLYYVDYDHEWCHKYTKKICEIKYCPFCSEKL